MVLALRLMHVQSLLVVSILVPIVGLVVGGVQLHPLSNSDVFVPFGAIIPLVPAIVISTSALPISKARELGATARLTKTRTLFVISCVVVAAASLLPIGPLLPNGQHWASLVRNLLALTAFGVICGTAFGRRFAWVLPLLWVMVPPFVFHRMDGDQSGMFLLVVEPDGNAGSWVLTGIASLLACAAVALWRPLLRSRS